jgi:hypothetical protein
MDFANSPILNRSDVKRTSGMTDGHEISGAEKREQPAGRRTPTDRDSPVDVLE